MFDETKKYSEQEYLCKQDIYTLFKTHIGSIVWNEIEQYRQIFIRKWNIQSYEICLVLNAYVNIQMEQTFTACCRWITQISSFTNKRSYQWQEEMNIYHYKQNQVFQGRAKLAQFCERNHILISCELLEHIQDPSINMLIRLFSIHLLCDVEKRDILISLCLCDWNLELLAPLLCGVNVPVEKSQHDDTYNFLAFLSQIRLKISQEMISLMGEQKHEQISMNEAVLLERYPQLALHQIQFYIKHRTYDHFYTIQQYMDQCHVCYETARYSLDEMVKMQWYDKYRMGKKYVYSVA